MRRDILPFRIPLHSLKLNYARDNFTVTVTTQFIQMKLHGYLGCDISFPLLIVMLKFGETWQNHRYLFYTRLYEFQNQLECRGGKKSIFCQESHPDSWVIQSIRRLIPTDLYNPAPWCNAVYISADYLFIYLC